MINSVIPEYYGRKQPFLGTYHVRYTPTRPAEVDADTGHTPGVRQRSRPTQSPSNHPNPFKHRPKEGTELKNKLESERPVGLPEDVMDVLETYIEHRRSDTHDDYGRAPLFTTREGRSSEDTIRKWSYLATLPCRHSPCPHGKERACCDWTTYAAASKCPSSRSPHQVRTGTITWQLNLGFPPPVVANRVNASPQTIRNHYDKADKQERRRRQRRRMETDRRDYVQRMNFNHDIDTNRY